MTGTAILKLILAELQSLPDCQYSVQFLPGIEAAISVEWRRDVQISIVIDKTCHVSFTIVEKKFILKPGLYEILNSLTKIFANPGINIFEHNGKIFFESFLPIWIRSEDIRHACRTSMEFLVYAYNLTKEMAFAEYLQGPEETEGQSDIEGFTDSILEQDGDPLVELDDEEADESTDADEELIEELLASFEKEKRKKQIVAIIRSLSGMIIDMTQSEDSRTDDPQVI